jgi:hypothetical protein
MLEMLLRLSAEVGPDVIWIARFLMAVIAVILVYIGVAMQATLVTKDPNKREICYRVFRDLLGLLHRRRDR